MKNCKERVSKELQINSKKVRNTACTIDDVGDSPVIRFLFGGLYVRLYVKGQFYIIMQNVTRDFISEILALL